MPDSAPYIGPYSGFTLFGGEILHSILTDAFVSLPPSLQEAESRPQIQVKALWDTGATNCVITNTLAKQLELDPITQLAVRHGGGITMENVFLLDIILINGVRYEGMRVSECNDASKEFDIIIGMDIICTGDLAITNSGGTTVVSFRHPSKSHIDFDDEIMHDNELFYQNQHTR